MINNPTEEQNTYIEICALKQYDYYTVNLAQEH